MTLLRDQGSLVPFARTGAGPAAARRVMLVQYMPETELRAGRYLPGELRAAGLETRAWKVTPRTSPAELDSIARAVRGADRVVFAAYVRRIEGEGRNAIPAHIAAWADSLAGSERLVFIALGNPYLIRQVPRVNSYVMTYGVNEVLERAAGRAITGRARITGKTPVGLPGVFSQGEGIQK